MTLIEKLKLIDRVDSLIRRRNTGTPKELSSRLNLSERSIYNLIDQMKKLGAPISYCNSSQSYKYENPVIFNFGFLSSESNQREIVGGSSVLIINLN